MQAFHRAIEWLKRKKHYNAIGLLSQLPWTYQLPRTMGYCVSDLAPLYLERWLGGEHVDSMLEVLKDNLESKGPGIHASIQGIQFMWKLIEIYCYSHNKYAKTQNCKFVRDFADKLKMAKVSVFSTAVAVQIGGDDVLLPKGEEIRANHWCAVVINMNWLTIQYGDPMGKAPPSELLDIIHWWLGLSFSTTFSPHNRCNSTKRRLLMCHSWEDRRIHRDYKTS